MFIRGAIGVRQKWLLELDFSEELAVVEENWIKPGKMLSWKFLPNGFRIIGPPFPGADPQADSVLEMYTFPSVEEFKEWCFSPEHIAMHTKLIKAMKAAIEAGQAPAAGGIYHFHATDDPHADIVAIRDELREVYATMEQTDWVNMPAGAVQMMMLGPER